MEECEGARAAAPGQRARTMTRILCMSSMKLCDAAESAMSPNSSQGRTRSTAPDTETKMQHFDVGNRHQIKDAPPNTWATVHCRDVVTMSELARRGFHLVDMSGEVWTMRRAG